MAKKFTKAMLKVGEPMHSADGVVLTTPERLKHFAAQHTKLRKAGYSVPSRWEHADKTEDMLPLSREEFSQKLDGRHAVGEMVDFKLAKDGQSAELTFDISDARGIEQVESNRVKVSPIIAGWWRDGKGNEYRDVITHADLVERPVDHTQGPFVPVAENTVALSLEKYLAADVVRLAFGEDDDDPKKKKPEADAQDDVPAEAAAPSAPEIPAGEEKNPDAPKTATDKSKLAALTQHMAIIGIVIPSDTDESNLVDNLLTAFATYNAVMQKNEAEEPEQEEEPATVASPGYAAMSTETKAAVEYANRMHREGIKSNLKRLLEEGKISPNEHAERLAGVDAIRLSLDGDKPVASDLEKFIAARDVDLLKGAFWTPEQKTKLSTEAAAPPYRAKGEETDEETAAAVDAQLKRTGRLPASAA